jgi:hypothetical protein
MSQQPKCRLERAASQTIRRKKKMWFVRSASGTTIYEVDLENKTPFCTSVYVEKNEKKKCEHICAACYALLKAQDVDSFAIARKALKVIKGGKQPICPQARTDYNRAQTNEKDYFQILLAQLHREVSGQVTPSEPKKRPPCTAQKGQFYGTRHGTDVRAGQRENVRLMPKKELREWHTEAISIVFDWRFLMALTGLAQVLLNR